MVECAGCIQLRSRKWNGFNERNSLEVEKKGENVKCFFIRNHNEHFFKLQFTLILSSIFNLVFSVSFVNSFIFFFLQFYPKSVKRFSGINELIICGMVKLSLKITNLF